MKRGRGIGSFFCGGIKLFEFKMKGAFRDWKLFDLFRFDF